VSARAKRAGPGGLASQDLTGTWTNASYTWLQRPKALVGKPLVLTPAEAEAYEGPRRRLRGELASKEDALGQNESEFPDNGAGLARIGGEVRSSWIVDPADGRIPWKPEAQARLKIGRDTGDYDNVEARDTDERCLTNASGFAPLVNSHDANLIQIVQTKGWVAIVGEKNHETRIVQIVGDGAPAPGAGPAGDGLGSWTGVSLGHWEGATLVVETTRLRRGVTKVSDDLYLSDQARVTERFIRTGSGEIAYRFVVSDPSLFTQVWRGEEIFRPAEGRMFEYACHEGNYSLAGLLQGARYVEAHPPAGP
jgi:hypothetical protein